MARKPTRNHRTESFLLRGGRGKKKKKKKKQEEEES